MRKSDKKLDNQIVKALTQVCHFALEDIDGFEWLTHTVNFDRFPESLKVVCVFNRNDKLAHYLKSSSKGSLALQIINQLADIGIELKNAKNQIELDSEENCTIYHGGNWRKRLA